jgi:hypothetical protein
MNVNHLDAAAITRPGGLYGSINDGLLQSLRAYFEHQDNERRGARDLQRDERMNARQQRNDAIAMARSLGVRPDAADTGWMPNGSSEGAISAAIQQYQLQQQQEAEQRQAAMLVNRAQRLKLAEQFGAGVLPPGTATKDDALAVQRGAQERALAESRAKVADEEARVQLERGRAQAAWDSVPMRVARGAGDRIMDLAVAATKASGRKQGHEMSGPEINFAQSIADRKLDAMGLTIYVPDPNNEGKRIRQLAPGVDWDRDVVPVYRQHGLPMPEQEPTTEAPDTDLGGAGVLDPNRRPTLSDKDQAEVDAMLARRQAKRAGTMPAGQPQPANNIGQMARQVLMQQDPALAQEIGMDVNDLPVHPAEIRDLQRRLGIAQEKNATKAWLLQNQ